MPQLPTTMRSADAKFCGNYDSQKFMEVSNSFSDVTNNGKIVGKRDKTGSKKPAWIFTGFKDEFVLQAFELSSLDKAERPLEVDLTAVALKLRAASKLTFMQYLDIIWKTNTMLDFEKFTCKIPVRMIRVIAKEHTTN